ncbi:MFS transporter [Vagococcus coleopterorum]|uniref:MFS transporter n=1 Tax=Vagococcus coleopterorum TaxID=2714946 RepID=A0A6G8AN19_9ENTE|nr:MFS transporter [Vagococcus coleopterorum]QIL46370.1 MFS transporter [Vagococcus coleopterorum]
MSKKTVNKSLALGILVLGVFMSALDNGIISAALTTINSSFDVSEVQGSWGITLYTLGMAISTPIIGKMADRYGRKKLFLAEIFLFAIGSLLVALSTNFTLFLAARFVQALGGGGIFIIASSFVLTVFPKEKQGGLLGMLGAVNGIASVVGPNIGSLVLKATNSWHWLFLINLPIAVAILISAYLWVPETKNPTNKKTDYIGTVFLSLGILSFMLAITSLDQTNLMSSLLSLKVLGFLLGGIILFTGLFFIEKGNQVKEIDPILDYRLLTNRNFMLTLFMGLLTGTLIAIFVYIPSFVEHRLGVSANQAGIYMSGIGLASIVGAGSGGRFVDKKGAVQTIQIASFISLVGFGSLAFFATNTTTFLITSTIAGLGFGMLMGAPLSVLASEEAGKEKGSALGTLSVSRQVGLTIAPTLYAALIQNGFNSLMPQLTKALPSEFVTEQLSQVNQHSVESTLLGLTDLAASPEKNQALAIFRETAGAAYQRMFLFSAIASGIIFFLSFVLKNQKTHRKLEN